MTNEEEKKIIRDLCTSPDFLSALNECIQNVGKEETLDIREIGIWFFAQGYLSSLRYQEIKERFRPFKFNPEANQ